MLTAYIVIYDGFDTNEYRVTKLALVGALKQNALAHTTIKTELKKGLLG